MFCLYMYLFYCYITEDVYHLFGAQEYTDLCNLQCLRVCKYHIIYTFRTYHELFLDQAIRHYCQAKIYGGAHCQFTVLHNIMFLSHQHHYFINSYYNSLLHAL